jgi:hypothetical protein
MGGIGFLFMMVYLAVMAGVIAISLISLWRGMRAQEEMARALNRIEDVLERRSPPV